MNIQKLEEVAEAHGREYALGYQAGEEEGRATAFVGFARRVNEQISKGNLRNALVLLALAEKGKLK